MMNKNKVGIERMSVGAAVNMVEVFIKSSDPERTKARIMGGGGKVRSIVGSIMTASLSENAIEEATKWPEVEYIEVAKPISEKNNVSCDDTNVSLLHSGTELPSSYDGKDVIVGVIDLGIDLNHPSFFDENGKSRILFVWDQGDNTGSGPSEIGSTYGTEYDSVDIANHATNHVDVNGHGTHVAGTAAGRDDQYGGVAPGASIIVVKYKSVQTYSELVDNTFSTYISDAAYYIFQKASALGKPAVINISSGTNMGPHDGTSLFEQFLDALIESRSGQSIVVSAGNSATPSGGQHIGYSVNPAINSASTVYVGNSPIYYIDIWEESDCNTGIIVGLVEAGVGVINDTGWVSSGADVGGFWGPMYYEVNRVEISNSQNGKRHSYVAILPDSGFDPNNYFFITAFSGTCSNLDSWVYPSDGSILFGAVSGDIGGVMYYPGNNVSTITSPATASNVIAVAAYGTRNTWTDMDGTFQDMSADITIGDLANFSSRGPALESNQGQKPFIAAPGAYTVSALSSNASPDSVYVIDSLHQAMQGTSMAAPHVTGIISLMLQAYPGLTNTEIRNYLESTARSDSFVGSVPNDDWGYGKIDALAAVKAVLAEYPPAVDAEDEVADENPTTSPNETPPPNNEANSDGGGSGGGCEFIPNNGQPCFALLVFIIFLAIIPVGIRRIVRH